MNRIVRFTTPLIPFPAESLSTASTSVLRKARARKATTGPVDTANPYRDKEPSQRSIVSTMVSSTLLVGDLKNVMSLRLHRKSFNGTFRPVEFVLKSAALRDVEMNTRLGLSRRSSWSWHGWKVKTMFSWSTSPRSKTSSRDSKRWTAIGTAWRIKSRRNAEKAVGE